MNAPGSPFPDARVPAPPPADDAAITPGAGRVWMLCAPALHPEDVQGRGNLFWSEEQGEWVECLDEATRYTDAEKAALDLRRFEDADNLEWWTELPRRRPFRQFFNSPMTRASGSSHIWRSAMAGYYTQFSTEFPIGSAANVGPALALYRQLADELEAAGETIGFEATESGTPDAPHLWLCSDGNGEPEHVITFALRCAERFDLAGRWGFRWALSASKPRLDAFGGGAHVLDLGRRETVAWVDCDEWLASQLAVDEAPPLQAEALLQDAAEAQGWTAATQAAVLLHFIDGLIAPDPDVAHRLRAHLAAASAEDGIDHDRDRNHMAIADEEVPPHRAGAAP